MNFILSLAAGESQHLDALGVHPCIAGFVFLLALRGVVRLAVEFDHELGLEAIEIGRVRAEGVLAAKFLAAALAIAEELLEIEFGAGGRVAQAARELDRVEVFHGDEFTTFLAPFSPEYRGEGSKKANKHQIWERAKNKAPPLPGRLVSFLVAKPQAARAPIAAYLPFFAAGLPLAGCCLVLLAAGLAAFLA